MTVRAKPGGRLAFTWVRPEGWTWVLLICVLLGSGWAVAHRPFNPDVSWDLTLGDRILDGARLYRDVIETNPPMTALLYLPASAASRVAGLRSEDVLVGLTGLFFVASLAMALRTLKGASSPTERVLFIGLWVICGWLMWLDSFAEREHVAVMALLPSFALWSLRSERRPVDALSIVVGGLGGGLATAIKPYFCLCLILPALHCAILQRNPRALLLPEYLIAAVVASIYAVTSFWLYPIYFHSTVPILEQTYLSYRLPVSELLFRPEWLLCLSWMLVLCAIRPGLPAARSWAVAALSAGFAFFIACLLQAKGYANHILPAVSLAAFGVLGLTAPGAIAAFCDERAPFLARSLNLLGIAWVAGTLAGLTVREDQPVPLRSLALLGAAEAIPGAKTVMTVSLDLDVGHPFARSAGLRYVGSVSSLWLTGSALERRDRSGTDDRTKSLMDGYVASDLARLCGDIVRERPDLIVFDSAHVSTDYLKRRAPMTAAAIAGYRPVAARNGLKLLERIDGRVPPRCPGP